MSTPGAGHTAGPYAVFQFDSADEHLSIIGGRMGPGWVAIEATGEDGGIVAYCHEKNSPLFASAPTMLAALEACEKRLTAVARAFYQDGKVSALRAAFDGWKADIEPARAALSLARGARKPSGADARASDVLDEERRQAWRNVREETQP